MRVCQHLYASASTFLKSSLSNFFVTSPPPPLFFCNYLDCMYLFYRKANNLSDAKRFVHSRLLVDIFFVRVSNLPIFCDFFLLYFCFTRPRFLA